MLEPCGEKNPAPQLSIPCHIRACREVRGGHLKLDLEITDGQRLGGFAPNMGHRVAELNRVADVNGATDLNGAAGSNRAADSRAERRGLVWIVGRLRRDTYRGGDATEILVTEITAESESAAGARNPGAA